MTGAATMTIHWRTLAGIAFLGLIVLAPRTVSAADLSPVAGASKEPPAAKEAAATKKAEPRADSRVVERPPFAGGSVSVPASGEKKPTKARETDAPPVKKPPFENLPAEVFAALVRQLGDPSYAKRCEAAARLAKCGMGARKPLLMGLENPDPEIRRSCRRLMADALEADFRSRLEALMADTEGKQEHDLPCWSRFRDVYGTDPAARKLFVEMQQVEPALMEAAEAADELAEQAFTLRFQQAMQGFFGGDYAVRRQPHLATFAALLFVAVDSKLRLPQDVLANPMWGNVFYQFPLQ